MTDENIKDLIAQLNNKDQIIALRLLAIEKIAEHNEKAIAVKALCDALLDDNEEIRSYAAEILGKIGDKNALFPLIDALQDGSSTVRIAAINSLAELKDNQAISAISARLKDESIKVRIAAVKALGSFDDVEVVKPLFRASSDSNEEVRKVAEEEIISLELSDKVDSSIIEPFLEHPLPFCRDLAVRFIPNRIIGSSLNYLAAALKDPEWEVRFSAVKQLSKLAKIEKEAIGKIIDLCIDSLSDENSKIKLEAIDTLRELNAEKAEDKLIELSTKDKDEKVRFEAIDALTEIRRAKRIA